MLLCRLGNNLIKLLLNLRLKALDLILEVFLLLLQDFVFPLPEGLESESFDLVLSLVFFEYFNGVSDQLDIGHSCTVVFAKTQVLNTSETSGQVSVKLASKDTYSYLGTSSFLTCSIALLVNNVLFSATFPWYSPCLAFLINFSIKGLISFARSNVVVIRS